MDPAHLSRLAVQSAESSRLLGVDFVPVYPGAVARACQLPVAAPSAASPYDALAVRQPVAVEAPSIPASSVPPPRASAPGRAPVFDSSPVERTPEAVQAALDALRARYEADAPHKAFVTAHSNIVFGEGDPMARLMFIGEAPGAEEDKTGRPFVGRAGQLLNRMIEAMGLARHQVYIANVLKTRPPDNATPTSEEIRICAPYLYQQIALIQPEVIVTLGLPASRALLQTMESMSRLRGRWHTFHAPPPADRDVPVMPTYHPAFLLRSYTAENRGRVWSDLQQVMQRLGLQGRQMPVQ